MQDAETWACEAKAAEIASAAAQADLDQCRSSVMHLKQVQKLSQGSKGNAVAVAKQLVELRSVARS